MLSLIHFSSEVTGAKTDMPSHGESLYPKLTTPMTIAVSSENMLLGTTKGPPESPLQVPFPPFSDPAQRNNLGNSGKHLEGGSKGNPTYLNLYGLTN